MTELPVTLAPPTGRSIYQYTLRYVCKTDQAGDNKENLPPMANENGAFQRHLNGGFMVHVDPTPLVRSALGDGTDSSPGLLSFGD
jgi:hypothetical protein